MFRPIGESRLGGENRRKYEKVMPAIRKKTIFAPKSIPMTEQEPEEKLIFPQNFDIKVIVAASVPIEESKACISRVFSECKTVYSFVSTRASTKGSYITYTYNIDLDSQEQMNAVYDGLKQVTGIKFAL